MKKIVGLWLALVMLAKVNAASPDWNITPSDYEYSMTVTAVLNIDGIIADEATDKVGAFVDGVCRGTASPSSFTMEDGRKLVFLQIYSNSVSGENVTFQLYDTSKDLLIDAVNKTTFLNDGSLGTTSEPYIITSNENPTDITLSSLEILEGIDKGTFIGVFSVTDPDGGSTKVTYSLVSGDGGTDNAYFTIKGDSLISNAIFDHDAKSGYSILVQVDDGKGGTFQKPLTIHVIADPNKFSAGNYISPNGDGKNDVWKIKNIEIYSDFKVTIFNDASMEVFSTTGYNNDWGGTYDGKELPAGVYYYLVEGPENRKFTGSITLNR